MRAERDTGDRVKNGKNTTPTLEVLADRMTAKSCSPCVFLDGACQTQILQEAELFQLNSDKRVQNIIYQGLVATQFQAPTKKDLWDDCLVNIFPIYMLAENENDSSEFLKSFVFLLENP